MRLRLAMLIIAAAAVLCAGAPARAQQWRLVEHFAPCAADDTRFIAGIGLEKRRTMVRAVEERIQRMRLDGATLVLREGEDFQWPGTKATGLVVAVKPAKTLAAYLEPYPFQYHTVSREDFREGKAVVALRDVPKEVTEANVRIRFVESKARSWQSGVVEVPRGAQLQCAYGVVADWPAAEAGDYRFTVTVHAEEQEERLFTRELSMDHAARRWEDLSLDLSPWAGKTVQFTWSCEAAGADTADSVTPVWSTARMVAPLEGPLEKRNIIFISLDTLRADHLSSLGYHRSTSPSLDAFAGEGVNFTDAMSTSGWTTPSHASIFTGALPLEHGAGSWHRGYILKPEWQTMAEKLTAAGYVTAAFTEGGALAGGFGFCQGFDRYSDGPEGEAGQTEKAEKTFAMATDWLRHSAAGPFFLFIHTFEIHDPYCSAPPEGHRYIDPDKLTNKCIYEKDLENEDLVPHAIDLYDGGILKTDAEFGKLVNYLKSSGLWDTTAIIVTSDHGEEFGEHGGYGHTTQAYRELIHVPLMVRLPDAEALRGPVDQLVSTCDIAPTIVELAGAGALETATDGRSLVPLLLPGTGRSYEREHAFLHYYFRKEEHTLATNLDHEFAFYSVRTRDARYMLSNRAWLLEHLRKGERPVDTPVSWRREVFDWKSDPRERVNLAGQDGDVMAELRSVLERHLAPYPIDDYTFPGEASGAGQPVEEDTVDALRALGYLD
jgi:arylsulfatase A-like enzyme